MDGEDDLGAELARDTRRRRRRLVAFLVGLPLACAATALAWATLREREVHLIGGARTVHGEIEGVTRFRLVAPYGATVHAGPGAHAIRGVRGPARRALSVPWAPWTSQIAAPVEEGQCLIVASGSGLYEGGSLDELYIHEVTTETREVALPPMTDVVALHPCGLPPAIRLLDTIVVIATVPCADAPRGATEARARVLAMLLACE